MNVDGFYHRLAYFEYLDKKTKIFKLISGMRIRIEKTFSI